MSEDTGWVHGGGDCEAGEGAAARGVDDVRGAGPAAEFAVVGPAFGGFQGGEVGGGDGGDGGGVGGVLGGGKEL